VNADEVNALTSREGRPQAASNPVLWWSLGAIGGALWFLLVRQLQVEWSLNPQYSYGWSVPFLMLYLLWGRWQTRPAPEPARGSRAALVIAGLLMLSLLPLRLVQEANPEWRLLSWAFALQTVGFTLTAVWFAAGSRFAKHFAVPVLFFLVAVPWPVPFENAVVQGLMRITASCTTEALRACGIEAAQRGNLIQLAAGVIGIDEACSGVRSLQATLMLSLFLGEFYRLGWGARLLMVASGAAVAMLANLGRAFSLTFLAQRNGFRAMEEWHDPAGFVVLGICLLCLWAIARCFVSKSSATNQTALPEPQPGSSFMPLPRPVLAAFASCIVVAEVGTELWYRAHEREARPQAAWAVSWPTANPSFQEGAIHEGTRAMLRYNEGRSGAWTAADGTRWQMFFMRWLPGRNAAQLAKGHNPRVCLPASGVILDADLGLREITVHGVSLPFRAYIFNDGRSRPLHVFHCLWDAHALDRAAVREDGSPLSRLRAARHGRRHLGQQMLQVAVRGYSNPDDAQRALADLLRAELPLAVAKATP